MWWNWLRAWKRWSALAGTILLAGCAVGAVSDVVVVLPSTPEYSDVFNQRLASWLHTAEASCDRVELDANCSAAARIVEDHFFLLDKLDALRGSPELD